MSEQLRRSDSPAQTVVPCDTGRAEGAVPSMALASPLGRSITGKVAPPYGGLCLGHF